MKVIEAKIKFVVDEDFTDNDLIEFLYFNTGYSASITARNELFDYGLSDFNVEITDLKIKER